jgi:hypothetical protein
MILDSIPLAGRLSPTPRKKRPNQARICDFDGYVASQTEKVTAVYHGTAHVQPYSNASVRENRAILDDRSAIDDAICFYAAAARDQSFIHDL